MVTAFSSVVGLYDDYLRALQAANALQEKSDLALEAEQRLRQIDWLFDRAHERVQELAAIEQDIAGRRCASGISPADPGWATWLRSEAATEIRARGERENTVAFELKLYIEAFYYFAWRLRRILRCLPSLRGFESPGLRDVRNHLVEHPEGAGGFTQQAWSWGGEEGPRLKPFRDARRGGECVDRGFYVNAYELRDILERRLQSALRVRASGPLTHR
jgi:hypothetical protein